MQDINEPAKKLPISRIRCWKIRGDGVMDSTAFFLLTAWFTPDDARAGRPPAGQLKTYTYNLYSYRDTNGDGKAG